MRSGETRVGLAFYWRCRGAAYVSYAYARAGRWKGLGVALLSLTDYLTRSRFLALYEYRGNDPHFMLLRAFGLQVMENAAARALRPLPDVFGQHGHAEQHGALSRARVLDRDRRSALVAGEAQQ